jgi:hypothetical protein
MSMVSNAQGFVQFPILAVGLLYESNNKEAYLLLAVGFWISREQRGVKNARHGNDL